MTTCDVCGEKTPLAVVCCDLLIDELDEESRMADAQPIELELVSGEVVIINPGDTAVLSFDRSLTQQEADQVRQYWANHAPDTNVVIIGKPAALAAVIRAHVIQALDTDTM